MGRLVLFNLPFLLELSEINLYILVINIFGLLKGFYLHLHLHLDQRLTCLFTEINGRKQEELSNPSSKSLSLKICMGSSIPFQVGELKNWKKLDSKNRWGNPEN